MSGEQSTHSQVISKKMNIENAAAMVEMLGIDNEQLDAAWNIDGGEGITGISVKDLSFDEYKSVVMVLFALDPFCIDNIDVEILTVEEEDQEPYQIHIGEVERDE
jgi:hypothetical protein